LFKRLALYLFVVSAAFSIGQPAFACPAVRHTVTYTVSAGDTLWGIASRFGTSVAALEQRNGLTDASILALGESIAVGDRYARSSGCAMQTHRAKSALRKASHRGHAARSAAVRRVFSPLAGRQALWAATHVGSLPVLGLTTVAAMEQAQRVLSFDARITATAMRYLGVPYSWGGTSFDGVDCSGFVWAVFAKNGIDLPRMADGQFETGHHVRVADLRPGDLVFFQTYAPGASHVGIYIGAGKFVHASASDGVRIDQLAEDYYASRFIGARRLTGV
jgi:cell wall-associated NlpC family hydrolase